MSVFVPPNQAAKAWTATAGAVVTTAAFLLTEYGSFVPEKYAAYVVLASTILTAVGVFFTHNKLTDDQIREAQALPPVPPAPPVPTSAPPWL